MRIGDLAEQCGLPSRTIRYYERRGLLPPPLRSGNGYRVYTEVDRDRLEFIRTAQAAGLTLNEIGGIVQLRNQGTTPCAHVTELLNRKLHDVQQRIEQLTSLHAELHGLIEHGRGFDPATCTERDICRILQPRPNPAEPRTPLTASPDQLLNLPRSCAGVPELNATPTVSRVASAGLVNDK
ncbi:MAG: heavy metal-responsive transcriptional regulator [Acidimicrobiia bacterium]